MKSEITGKAMVFAKDFNGRTAYSVGLSKKNMEGEWINGFIPVGFRKGVNLADRTKIVIEKGWLDFYLNKDGKTVPTLFILEFSTESQDIPEGFIFQEDDEVPF